MAPHASFAVLALLLLASATADQTSISNSKQLEDFMYVEADLSGSGGGGGDACVKLLNASGTIGCAAPGSGTVVGTLVRIATLPPSSATDYPEHAAFLLPPELLAPFLKHLGTDAALLHRVAGVLVEAGMPPSWSQAERAPQAPYALYADERYEWNPAGTGVAALDLPFPLFQLDAATTQAARERAAYNAEQKNWSGALNVARMELAMEAVPASGNSSACLAAKTCLPLGGHSVLAALPPLRNPTGPEGNLPLVLALATSDSTALFHDLATGAEAQVSGLIALLTAANILGSAPGTPSSSYSKHIVFAALAGECWGYMGSKRLLWELEQRNASVAGLALANVAAILEVGAVGRSGSSSAAGGGSVGGEPEHTGSASSSGAGVSSASMATGSFSLYMHVDKQPGAASTSNLQAALTAAAAAAGSAVGAEVRVAPAGSATPGLPPASAASFLRVAGAAQPPLAIPAVVLADFDAVFRGPPTYHSSDDALANISTGAVAAAAVTLAHALHAQAWDPALPLQPLAVNYTEVQALVESLAACLLNGTVGLQCPLAAAMMTPTSRSTSASKYVGILRTLTADPQTPDPWVKSDYDRFLWNFLAFATTPDYTLNTTTGVSSPSDSSGSGSGDGGGAAGQQPLATTPPPQRCQPYNASACPPGWACAGYRNLEGDEGKGVCLNTTVRFVPAYSTALECVGCNGSATLASSTWRPTNAAAAWEAAGGWPLDPAWAESNWPVSTPALTLYLQEAASTEWALLGAGLAATVVSLVAAIGVQLAWERRRRRGS